MPTSESRANSAGHATKTSVFFVGETANCILRAAQAANIVLPESSIRTLPLQAPLKTQVMDALLHVYQAFPNIQLPNPVHIVVGGHARCKANDHYVSQSCSATLASGSFYRLRRGIYVASPALSFILSAPYARSKAELIQNGFGLCGTYFVRTAQHHTAYGVAPLISARALREGIAANHSVVGAVLAKKAAKFVADGSASPKETQLALVLGLPMNQGGAGLGLPCMNYAVEASRQARLVSGRQFFKCDLCWPDVKVDVEYQSRMVHEGEASRISDSRRANALESMGWTVISVTNNELANITAIDVIGRTIRAYLGKDPRIRVKNYYQRRLTLWSQLGLPVDSWASYV